jgi:hypothetical protein
VRAVEVVRRHPRHLVLFALTAGLLLGPVAPAAALAAAGVAAWLAGRVPLALIAAVAVLAGATLAQARVATLSAGQLPSLAGRTVDTRAILLEPVRTRRNGSAVARVRLVGRTAIGGSGAAGRTAAGGARDPGRDGDGTAGRAGGGGDGTAGGTGGGGDGTAGGAAAITDDLDGEVAVARATDGRVPDGVRVGSELRLRGSVAPLGEFDAYQRKRGALAAVEVASWEPTGGARGG